MNARVRSAVHEWIPSALFRIVAPHLRLRVRFAGSYSSWAEALAGTRGYNAQDILSRVCEATHQVLRGGAAFERDGVPFDKPSPPFALIAAVLRAAALTRERLHVVDFGGALGSSYYQCRPFVSSVQDLRWSIVEQEDFVRVGRSVFESETLRFYGSIEECVKELAPSIILLSGVLQYLEQCHAIMTTTASLGATSIVIDRTPIIAGAQTHLARQVVPWRLGSASYPVWLFSREELLEPFSAAYRVLSEFEAVDGVMSYGFARVDFRGFILDKIAS